MRFNRYAFVLAAATGLAGCTVEKVVYQMPAPDGGADLSRGRSVADAAPGLDAPPLDLVGATTGVLQLADGATYDFGGLTAGQSLAHDFEIVNNSATTVEGITFAVTGAGFSSPGHTTTCTGTLGPAAFCTVSVDFSPAGGTQTGELVVTFETPGTTQSAFIDCALAGHETTLATLTISDGPTYDFGELPLSDTASHTFTVHNAGGDPLTGISGAVPDASSFSFVGFGNRYPGTGGTCGTSLAAGASCTVVVQFVVSDVVPASSTLTIAFTNATTTEIGSTVVALAGTGRGSRLAFTVPDDDYFVNTVEWPSQSEQASSNQTIGMVNAGNVTATITGTTFPGSAFQWKGGAYPGIGGTCGASLVAQGKCSLVVTFAFATVGDAPPQTLTVDYVDVGASLARAAPVVMTGTIVDTNVEFRAGATFDFGTVTTDSSSTQLVYVDNHGTQDLEPISATISGAGFSWDGAAGFPGADAVCNADALYTQQSCAMAVTFLPSSSGPASGTLTFNYTDAEDGLSGSVTVTLVGQGN